MIINGNSSNNTLAGYENQSDTIHGNGGNDKIFGSLLPPGSLYNPLSYDLLYGDDGDDTIISYSSSTLYGGTGYDFLQVYFAASFQETNLPTKCFGGDGNDTIMAQGGPGHYFYLYGDAGDDIIKFTCGEAHGGDGADTIEGMAGPIFGDAGNDTLKGNSGTDTIHGGADNDTINGKADADILYGDAGIDTFIFEHGTGSDTIKDFVHGTDKIDLTDYHFTSFAALLAAMGESAGSAFINLGSGDLVVFEGVALASLDAGDFLL